MTVDGMATKYIPPQRRTEASPWAKPTTVVAPVEQATPVKQAIPVGQVTPVTTRYVPPSQRELVKANPERVDTSEKNFPSLGQSKAQAKPGSTSGLSLSDMIKDKIKRDSELNNGETDSEKMSYEQLAKDGWCVIHIPSKTYLTGPLEPI